MLRPAVLLLALISCRTVSGQDKDLEQTLDLQKVMQKAIARAEPSIACIFVSRSDEYRQLAGQAADASSTGRLGDFEPAQLDFPGAEGSQEKRFRLRQRLDMADPAHVPEAFGSGVVIDSHGLVLTNYHVIRDATKIYLRLPGNIAGYADIHAADPRSDLAILRLRAARRAPLPAVPLGDASNIQRGQFVLTLTNPYAAGFRAGEPSASWGIISNLRSHIAGLPQGEEERTKPLYYYGTLLQTDARLHLGCSGGALLNLNGELIGLTTSLAAIQGSDMPGGFALPLDAGMRRILDVLLRGEEVDYGFLGIQFKAKGPGRGPAVEYVTPGSPAQQEANLQLHDVILAVDGNPVQESDDLFLHLGTRLAGTRITLRVRHADSAQISNVGVTLGKYNVIGKKIASSLGKRPFFRGLRVDYTTLLVQQPARPPHIPTGVLVTEVQPDSAAAEAQLKPGEVISHVNNRPITTPAAFYQTVADLVGPVEFQLYNFGHQEPPARVVVK